MSYVYVIEDVAAKQVCGAYAKKYECITRLRGFERSAAHAGSTFKVHALNGGLLGTAVGTPRQLAERLQKPKFWESDEDPSED